MKMVVGCGVIAVFSDEWISFGGLPLTANTVTMASLFKLRASGPLLECPFRAPFHPLFPAIALVCDLVGLFAVVLQRHALGAAPGPDGTGLRPLPDHFLPCNAAPPPDGCHAGRGGMNARRLWWLD